MNPYRGLHFYGFAIVKIQDYSLQFTDELDSKILKGYRYTSDIDTSSTLVTIYWESSAEEKFSKLPSLP